MLVVLIERQRPVVLPSTTGEPPKRLIGLRKIWLDAGASKTVSITIDPNASNHPLRTWDKDAQRRDGKDNWQRRETKGR
nr:fibronectin type III-like domain-contianing protein [uncultured Ralstonia sp.]